MTPTGPGQEYLLINVWGLQYVTVVATTTELIIEAGDREAASKHLKWAWAEVRITDRRAVHHTRVKLPLLMLYSDTAVIIVPQISHLIE